MADEAVIPIFLDDTKFVGIPDDIVGIRFHFDPTAADWEQQATNQMILKLIDKL